MKFRTYMKNKSSSVAPFEPYKDFNRQTDEHSWIDLESYMYIHRCIFGYTRNPIYHLKFFKKKVFENFDPLKYALIIDKCLKILI